MSTNNQKNPQPEEKVIDFENMEDSEFEKVVGMGRTEKGIDRDKIKEVIDKGEVSNEKEEKEPDKETEENEEVEQLQGQEEQPQEEDREEEEQQEQEQIEEDYLELEEDAVIKLDNLKVNHNEFDETFTKEELKANMQMAYDYPRVKKQVEKLRNKVAKLDEYKITDKDLEMYKAIKSGDKKVIAQYLKKNNIDPIDIDTDNVEDINLDNENEDKSSGFSEDVKKEALNVLQENKELYENMDTAITYLPNSVETETAKNLEYFKALEKEVENERFYKIAPKINAAINNNSKLRREIRTSPIKFWQAYLELGRQKGLIGDVSKSSNNQTNSSSTKKNVSSKKRKANPKPKGARSTKSKRKKKSPMEMSDSEFQKYRKELSEKGLI